MDTSIYLIAALVIVLIVVVLLMRRNKPLGEPSQNQSQAQFKSIENQVSPSQIPTTTQTDTSANTVLVAQQFIDQQRYDEAIIQLKKQLSVQPNNAQVMLKLLNVYAITNQHNAFDALYRSIQDKCDIITCQKAEEIKSLLDAESLAKFKAAEKVAAQHAVHDDKPVALDITEEDIRSAPTLAQPTQPTLAEPTQPTKNLTDLEATQLPSSTLEATEQPSSTKLEDDNLDLYFDDIESQFLHTPSQQDTIAESQTAVMTDIVDDHTETDEMEFVLEFDDDSDLTVNEFSDTLSEDAVIQDTAFEETVIQDTVIQDTAVEDAVVQDIVIEGTTADIIYADSSATILNDEPSSRADESSLFELDMDSIDTFSTEQSTEQNVDHKQDLSFQLDDPTLASQDSLEIPDSSEENDADLFELTDSNNDVLNDADFELDVFKGDDTDTQPLPSKDDWLDISTDTAATTDTPAMIDKDADINTSITDASTDVGTEIVSDEQPFATDFDFSDSTDATAPVDTAAPASAEFEPVIEATEDDIATPTESQPLTQEFDFINELDNIQITLDLAAQYLDLGEYDSAKRLLDEVIAQGDAQQQQHAKDLLAHAG